LVSNLNPETKAATLENLFSEAGAIQNLQMIKGNKAVVIFREVICAVTAKRKFHKTLIEGSRVIVDYD